MRSRRMRHDSRHEWTGKGVHHPTTKDVDHTNGRSKETMNGLANGFTVKGNHEWTGKWVHPTTKGVDHTNGRSKETMNGLANGFTVKGNHEWTGKWVHPTTEGVGYQMNKGVRGG